MQAASAVQVTIQRFGVWNMALGLVSATVVAVVAAGLISRSDDLPAWSSALLIATALAGLLGVVDLLRRRPIELRWDTQRWYVTDPRCGNGNIEVREVRVVLDLGAWMLLKFRADVPWHRLRGGWIPVQRQGIEAQWAPLRCAVYANGTGRLRFAALDQRAQHG